MNDELSMSVCPCLSDVCPCLSMSVHPSLCFLSAELFASSASLEHGQSWKGFSSRLPTSFFEECAACGLKLPADAVDAAIAHTHKDRNWGAEVPAFILANDPNSLYKRQSCGNSTRRGRVVKRLEGSLVKLELVFLWLRPPSNSSARSDTSRGGRFRKWEGAYATHW